MSGAARVYVTLDELAAMLELPPGHRLHAVDELPAGHCPGVALTIISEEGARPVLPLYRASDPLMAIDLITYRKWGTVTSPAPYVPYATRTVLREVEVPLEPRAVPRHPAADHQGERQNRPGRRADEPMPSPYMPAKPPVDASPSETWPKFPGEDLNYRGETERGDRGDEDGHMGGPR